MAITPTALLSLPIITTGTESGTWGDVVDNGLTAYLDIAIAGGLSVPITTADVTLANTAGTSVGTGITSTTAQYATLNISGAKTAARSLILPSSSRKYIINNAAATGGFLLTVKGAATSGVTLVDGEKAIVAWNGTDYAKITSSSVATITSGAINGTTIGGATPAAITGTTVTSTTQFTGPGTGLTGTAASLAVGSSAQIAAVNWTVVEVGGVLYFKYGGVNKASLDSAGNFTVVGDVTAYGTV